MSKLLPVRTDKVTRVFSPRRISAGLQFQLQPEQSARRKATEAYIARKYQQTYGAVITTFLPVLLTMNSAEKTIGAVGLNPGEMGPMYLEQYFDCPVEQKLASLTRQPQSRNKLVEIGNLVVTERGVGSLMFLVLAASLYRADAQWLIFTATPEVEKIVRRFRLEPVCLAAASPTCLTSAKQWGSYYDCHPKVLAVNLQQAFELADLSPLLKSSIDNFDTAIKDISTQLTCYRANQNPLKIAQVLADTRRSKEMVS